MSKRRSTGIRHILREMLGTFLYSIFYVALLAMLVMAVVYILFSFAVSLTLIGNIPF